MAANVYRWILAIAVLFVLGAFFFGSKGSVTGYAPLKILYYDADSDGYGNPEKELRGYVQPAGYVFNGNDCNDNRRQIHPGAFEVCRNKLDDNCNGLIDEGCK